MKINSKGEYALVVCPNPSVDILATIDSLQSGVPNRIANEQRYPGGKGVHVAMALAELGIEVVLAGFWGGATGQWIRNECLRYYPGIQFIGPEVSEWSRSSYTFKSSPAYNDTELLGAGPHLSELVINDFNEQISAHVTKAKALVLSGSWPQGAPQKGYRDLIELGRIQEIPAFLDCTGHQLTEALQVNPFCVHLNRKEITDYFNSDFKSSQLELLKYCEIGAITDGSKGLYLSSKIERKHSLSRVERVISTVGSGDCLLAGIVAGYIMNLPFSEIADIGAACGAANCLRPELGILRKEDVEMLLAEMPF